MNSRNFIWYALPMMLFLGTMWLFEPWFYQKVVASDDLEDIKKRDFKNICLNQAWCEDSFAGDETFTIILFNHNKVFTRKVT